MSGDVPLVLGLRILHQVGQQLGHAVLLDALPDQQVTRVTTSYLHRLGPRPSRMVAEQALARRSRCEVEDYMRIEAAANVVYQPFPVSILCPYDASALAGDVLLACACRECHLWL
jgi:hypothetical protein